MADIRGTLRQPFAEQEAFFKRKLNLPTERWDDIQRAAHDRAFVVAGATRADLLQDLRTAVDAAIKGDLTLDTFRQEFDDIVRRTGWTGWTGEGSEGGRAWRTRVIYSTNLRTSFAAGRWQQLTDPELLAERPYWRYVHSDLVMQPRALHKKWGDARLTLRWDHPFWQTHFPPNGWGCRCRVVAVAAPREGDATEPPAGWNAPRDDGTPPPGIDPGWDYAPGANAATPLIDLVKNKLFRLDAPVGAQMWQALEPAVRAEQKLALADMVDRISQTLRARGDAVLVGALTPAIIQSLQANRFAVPVSADIWLRDEQLLHALRNTKTARGAALPPSIWRNLVDLLAVAAVYWDSEDPSLVYLIDTGVGGQDGKVLIRVNYTDSLRFAGQRSRETANFVRTAGVADLKHFVPPRYIAL